MKVLLIAVNDHLTLPVLQSLAAESIRTDLMSPQPLRWSRLSRYSNQYSACSMEDLLCPGSAFADRINRYCNEHRIEIVIPVDVLPTACLAKIRQRLHIPVFPIPEFGVIRLVNNKWQFKQMLDQLGIPTPQTFVVDDERDLRSRNIQFPVVIKPLDRCGTRGVKRLDCVKDIDTYFADERNTAYRPLLIQEYLPGDDVCTSVLAVDGRLRYWTMQTRTPQGGVRFIEQAGILQAVSDICGYLKYTGLAHFDLRMDQRSNEFKFLECNPRFWGTLTASTFAGVNFAVLGICTALGRPVQTDTAYQRHLRLPAQVIEKSLIRLLVQGQISLNRAGFRYLSHVLCDPPVLLERMRKRLAKIVIPGKIRRKRAKISQIVIPPLSAMEPTLTRK